MNHNDKLDQSTISFGDISIETVGSGSSGATTSTLPDIKNLTEKYLIDFVNGSIAPKVCSPSGSRRRNLRAVKKLFLRRECDADGTPVMPSQDYIRETLLKPNSWPMKSKLKDLHTSTKIDDEKKTKKCAKKLAWDSFDTAMEKPGHQFYSPEEQPKRVDHPGDLRNLPLYGGTWGKSSSVQGDSQASRCDGVFCKGCKDCDRIQLSTPNSDFSAFNFDFSFRTTKLPDAVNKDDYIRQFLDFDKSMKGLSELCTFKPSYPALTDSAKQKVMSTPDSFEMFLNQQASSSKDELFPITGKSKQSRRKQKEFDPFHVEFPGHELFLSDTKRILPDTKEYFQNTYQEPQKLFPWNSDERNKHEPFQMLNPPMDLSYTEDATSWLERLQKNSDQQHTKSLPQFSFDLSESEDKQNLQAFPEPWKMGDKYDTSMPDFLWSSKSSVPVFPSDKENNSPFKFNLASEFSIKSEDETDLFGCTSTESSHAPDGMNALQFLSQYKHDKKEIPSHAHGNIRKYSSDLPSTETSQKHRRKDNWMPCIPQRDDYESDYQTNKSHRHASGENWSHLKEQRHGYKDEKPFFLQQRRVKDDQSLFVSQRQRSPDDWLSFAPERESTRDHQPHFIPNYRSKEDQPFFISQGEQIRDDASHFLPHGNSRGDQLYASKYETDSWLHQYSKTQPEESFIQQHDDALMSRKRRAKPELESASVCGVNFFHVEPQESQRYDTSQHPRLNTSLFPTDQNQKNEEDSFRFSPITNRSVHLFSPEKGPHHDSNNSRSTFKQFLKF